MKGFELNKTGARVQELLERQFIVPTLSQLPTSDTLSWEDGRYTTPFRVGEFCRVYEGNEYKFYRLHDLENNVADWRSVNTSEIPELSDYYTRDEVDSKIREISFPEDESIKNVTEDEYNAMLESDTLSDKTLYFISKDGSPIAIYIGKVQIAVREEGSKGFAYNFPIIF